MKQKMIVSGAAMCTLAFSLSACAPRDMESTPVVVNTAQGPVTCQLYTHDVVYWDRALDRPAGMSVKLADDVCRAEGQRRIDESRM